MKQTFKSYWELSKPGIVILILVTSAIGFYLGGQGITSWYTFLVTLVGTAMSGAGASALNNYLEGDVDCLMKRTCMRPIPSGRISPNQALLFGVILSLVSTILLAWQVNLLCGFMALLTIFLYALVYTPLKRLSWINTLIGAIPGALPIMGGWVAATGSISLGAWILFLIMFAWQHPHFFAIAWILKDDYAKAGIKMLPVVQPDGRSTFLQIILFSFFLLPVSILPTAFGYSGMLYFVGASVLGIMMIMYSFMASRTFAVADARRLFRFSIVYLPVLLVLIVVDHTF